MITTSITSTTGVVEWSVQTEWPSASLCMATALASTSSTSAGGRRGRLQNLVKGRRRAVVRFGPFQPFPSSVEGIASWRENLQAQLWHACLPQIKP